MYRVSYFINVVKETACSMFLCSNINISSYISPYIHDFFLGYAITAGAYFNEKSILYASSAPRGKILYGKVLVFDFPSKHNKPMVIKTIVEGKQLGEYFGTVLTSCDINNDHKHELIVGAPQWSKDMDEGRVYIFTSRRKVCYSRIV